MSCLYAIGNRNQDEVLITVEIIDEPEWSTKLSTTLVIKPENYHNPFYMSGLIDSGKIVAITDMQEAIKHLWADVFIEPEKKPYRLEVGKYFFVKGASYNKDIGLKCYRTKIAAVENSTECCSRICKLASYTGCLYHHWDGGNILAKVNYKNGVLHSSCWYRDDAFNTINFRRIYTDDGQIKIQYEYDENECLVGNTNV
jgi:hypothetical protein